MLVPASSAKEFANQFKKEWETFHRLKLKTSPEELKKEVTNAINQSIAGGNYHCYVLDWGSRCEKIDDLCEFLKIWLMPLGYHLKVLDSQTIEINW